MNNLGAGKFRTFADSNQEQTCYFNRNNSDSRYKSYVATCTDQDKLVFFIASRIFDQSFGYKNLEVNPENLLSNGNSSGKREPVDRENFKNGKRTGSEDSERYRRRIESNVSESASSRFRRGGGSENRGSRKKPRYLSN